MSNGETAAERIETYTILIAAEKRRIQEALENLADYSERLAKAAQEAAREIA